MYSKQASWTTSVASSRCCPAQYIQIHSLVPAQGENSLEFGTETQMRLQRFLLMKWHENNFSPTTPSVTKQRCSNYLCIYLRLFLPDSLWLFAQGALADKWIVHQSSLQCAAKRCPGGDNDGGEGLGVKGRVGGRGVGVGTVVSAPAASKKAREREVLQARWHSAKPPAESHPSVCILCKWVT